MKQAILTMQYGEVGRAMLGISGAWHDSYAKKHRLTKHQTICHFKTFYDSMIWKMSHIYDLLEEYDRVLWIDADILIHPNSPSLFDIVPYGSFGAVDECAIADNQEQIKYRHDHLAQTCQEEGLPVPDTKGRYFNCGMFVADKTHRELFKPRTSHSSHNWCEQSLVNARLLLRQHDVVSLPDCFNRFVYWGIKPQRFEDSSFFLHYAGPPSPERRLKDMAEQSRKWREIC